MAAALLLTACGKTNAGSGSSGSMSGSSSTSSAQTQTAAWKTGLGVVTEATDQDRAGKIELAAAAVLLDDEGKLESVLLDELEVSVSADSTGHVTLPTDWRTKRQKGVAVLRLSSAFAAVCSIFVRLASLTAPPFSAAGSSLAL